MNIKAGDKFELDYTVTEKIYEGFMDLFNDRSLLHTDNAFARKKNFQGKLMHGAILAGFLSNLIGDQLPSENLMSLHYDISFNKPFYLGDKLKLIAEVKEIFSSVNVMDIKFQFRNEGGEVISKGIISLKII